MSAAGRGDVDGAGDVVALEGVRFSYATRDASCDDELLALKDVSLRVPAGQRRGVLGPNGGGKSTLVKVVLGLLRPSAGSVRVFGREPVDACRAGLVGYVPQRTMAELAFPLSVSQVIRQGVERGLRPWQRLGAEARRAVDEAVELTGAGAFLDRPIGRLSGGQLQRAMIARAIAARPRLLILDEPAAGIDPAGQQRFAELLGRVHEAMGLTTILVSHDLRAVAAGCDAVACVARTLHAHTSPAGLTPAVLAEVFRHEMEPVLGDLHVDAHAAADCDDLGHSHGHAHGHGGAHGLGGGHGGGS